MSTPGWDAWLAEAAARREAVGLRRELVARGADDDILDLAGNDYLGLSRHPDVIGAAAKAATEWGAGAGASRLVTGTLELHAELERALADWTGWPDALVLSTGYQANLAVLTSLADRDTLVVSDAHVHASLFDGARLSRAEVAVVPHHDLDAVRRVVAAAGRRRCLLLTESVFSVLGDQANLVELAALAEEYGALVAVDEAHAVGVRGAGLVHELGLAGHPNLLVTLTLSKALGSQGGAVLGSTALREHLVNTARPFIFDTALAPAATAAALAAVEVCRRDPSRGRLVRDRMVELAARLGVETPAGAVLSVPMPSPEATIAARDEAARHGVRIGAFRPPSVPDGVSRLRITVNGGLTDAEWARALTVLEELG